MSGGLMANWYFFFKKEYGRLLSKRILLIGLLFFLISIFYTAYGVFEYNDFLKKIDDHKTLGRNTETNYLKEFSNYRNYIIYGIRVELLPPPLSILYCNTGFPLGATSHFNGAVQFDLYNSIKGKDFIKTRNSNFSDFANVFAMLGALLLLIYGFDTFRQTEYLKFLITLVGRRKTFLFLVTTRFLLIGLFFGFVAFANLLLIKVLGFGVSLHDFSRFAGYFALWLVIALFIFCVGILLGTIRSKAAGIIAIGTAWIVLALIQPAVISKVGAMYSNRIESNYRIDKKKWTYFTNFEKRIRKEMTHITAEKMRTDIGRKFIESFFQNELKQTLLIDREIEKQMRKSVDFIQGISSLSPLTFYISISDSLSGKGYEAVVDFHHICQELKKQFCLFYKQKEFYSKDKQIESFIKGDEDIYITESKFPAYTWAGVGVHFLYAFILCFIAYGRYIKLVMNPAKEDIYKANPKSSFKDTLELKTGGNYALRVNENRFIDFLYSALSGYKSGESAKYFTGPNKIIFDNKDIIENPTELDFLYLCKPLLIPGDIRAGDFIDFLASASGLTKQEREGLYKETGYKEIKRNRFNELSREKRFEVVSMAARVKGYKLYVIDNSSNDLPIQACERLMTLIDDLLMRGSGVILLTGNIFTLGYHIDKGTEFEEDTENIEGIIRSFVKLN